MENKMLTLEEVADYLRIGKQTVMKEIDSGALIGYKVGKLWRIKKEDLEKYLENNSSKNDD